MFCRLTKQRVAASTVDENTYGLYLRIRTVDESTYGFALWIEMPWMTKSARYGV